MSWLDDAVNYGSNLLSALSGYSNYKLQKKAFEWQKQQQEIMYQREDTAVQRRKADLIAAGMSPVLAAGQGASTSAPVKIEAPQMDTSFGSRAVDALQKSYSIAGQQKQLLQQDETIAKTRAERAYIEAQTRRSGSGYDLDRMNLQLLPARERLLNAQIKGKDAETYLKGQDAVLRKLQHDVMSYDLGASVDSGIRYKDQINPMTMGSGFLRNLFSSGSTGAITDSAVEGVNAATSTLNNGD